MKIRSQSAGQTQAAGRTEAKAADASARGQKLLQVAATQPVVPEALLGVPKPALDALAGGLLEGAILVAQRRSGVDE